MPSANAEVILNLVLEADERTEGMMPGWDIELARQKMLFFTTPNDFAVDFADIGRALDAKFEDSSPRLRERIISFMLGVAESLLAPVELDHNLSARRLHGDAIFATPTTRIIYGSAIDLVHKWSEIDPEALKRVLEQIKLEDTATNKGDNLFAGWARKWQEENNLDPYANAGNYISCFCLLYQKGMYYPDLYFAREQGETRTQFFNDYGLQAVRCRRMGSLGGTTNPAIAVLGEDDLSGKGNIWGQEATDYVLSFPNKWHEVRKIIAREQIAKGEAEDWGAVKFTEWVVVDAMLGLRSIFLLRGLGRVAFQLRPDWHSDEKKLTYAGGQIYDILCDRVKVFDDILLDGADPVYMQAAAKRIGKSNNHFKIACTGQAALNTIRSFNAGRSEAFPDAVKERMFTNVTLSYEVPQMYAASMATENGIRDYEKRTGEAVDDGEGGSVVTSMIGRFNDAIRDYRVHVLLDGVGSDLNPASIKKLTDPAINNADFIAECRSKGIEFDPEAEEDAIDRAGSLCTKRVTVLLQNESVRPRILTASKRNFFQNTELLDVPFSTDFGNIQRMYLDVMPLEIDDWKTLPRDMDADGFPTAGKIWASRNDTLKRIWPDWEKVFNSTDGVAASEYEDTIYVAPTLKQFIGMWNDNVARAKSACDEAKA
ncbi:MAG: hypothetical protein GX141_05900 [Armatimonadetes bacterium]|nr:hypothetical protein [Armatimonadota bacterium]